MWNTNLRFVLLVLKTDPICQQLWLLNANLSVSEKVLIYNLWDYVTMATEKPVNVSSNADC